MKHAIFIACLAVVLAFAASAGILRECTLTAADLPGLASGVVLRLPAFDGRTVTVSLGERRTSANGLSTFGATVEGSCGRDAVAVQTEDGFVLRAKDPRTGRTLEFRRKGDSLRVREREAAAPGPRTCTSRHFPSRQSDGKAAYLSRSALTGDPMVDGRRLLKGEVRTNVVDILMAYDASAAAWVRTESVFAGLPNSVEAFSAERIENMNNALVNTGLGDLFSFNLAGTLVITNNWDCRGSTEARQFEAFDRMLDALVSLKSGEQVRAAREACGADIVTFLVAANEYGTVGLSWSLDDNSIGQGDFDDYAYSVCSVSAVADGHTLTHEVGHTMGAGHADMSVAALAGPQLYGYSSGYTFAVTNALGETIGLYHTIMGYDRDGLVHPGAEGWDWAAEVPYFSSPNYTFAYEDEDPASGAPTVVDTGIPVGDARHDNTRLLAAVYPLVANFRVRKSSVTVVTPDGGGTAGPATGFGLLKPGESVTLKAVAATGYVFAGWYGRYDEADGTYAAPIAFDGGTDYRATLGKWTMPAGEVRSVRLYARFVRAEADAECRPAVSLEPAEDGYEAGKEIAPIVVTVDSLSLPTVTVKGLPSGLKFDAKALKIVGTPTKPGVYEVSVGARNKSRVTGEATVSVKVNNFTDPLVSWDESSNPEGLLDCYGPLVPGVPVSVAIPPARGWSASGLPSGLKFDGKTGLLSGAPTKPGTFTATFKATLKDPATGKSAAHVATATFVVDALRTLSVVKTGDSTGTGKLSGAGAYVAGKKVTVKATADTKDTATTKRSVFMAWYDGETLLSRNASYSYTMTADAEQTLSAKFITAEEDAASIALAVGGTELDADKPEERTLVCGVALVWDVAHEALSQTTVRTQARAGQGHEGLCHLRRADRRVEAGEGRRHADAEFGEDHRDDGRQVFAHLSREPDGAAARPVGRRHVQRRRRGVSGDAHGRQDRQDARQAARCGRNLDALGDFLRCAHRRRRLHAIRRRQERQGPDDESPRSGGGGNRRKPPGRRVGRRGLPAAPEPVVRGTVEDRIEGLCAGGAARADGRTPRPGGRGEPGAQVRCLRQGHRCRPLLGRHGRQVGVGLGGAGAVRGRRTLRAERLPGAQGAVRGLLQQP